MFHAQILIFTIFWIVLSFVQKFRQGLWCLGYALIIGGNVFLYQGVKLWGYVCILLGIVCMAWIVIIVRKRYDKFKYGEKVED